MIKPGAILIEKDALRPKCFDVEDSPYSGSWIPVKHNLTAHELERELAASGWTFFYMASPIAATAFGFDPSKRMQAALKRLIIEAKLHHCNSLEIDDVVTLSFLGLPYVSVSAHPRHIQTGRVFSRS